MTTCRQLALLLTVLVTAAVIVTPAGTSGATYLDESHNDVTVRAASDWTPPTVALLAPGAVVKDSVTLTASASDGETGVRDVVVERRTASGNWMTLCRVTNTPYTCGWNTRSVADGGHHLRAVATDGAGYSSTSEVVQVTVANNLTVVLSSPGPFVRGSVPLTTTLHDVGATGYQVQVDYSPAGAGDWRPACGSSAPPYTCSWNTSQVTHGHYDLRATASAGGFTTSSAVIPDVVVDNQAPSVAMADPGTPLSGMRTFAATASDTHSGVEQVVLQVSPSGSSTWQTLCTNSTEPWSCSYDTTQLPNGEYSFRATAADRAGNGSTSPVVTGRVVDNTVSTVSLADPGAFLSGTVTLSATAGSTAGIQSVRFQRAVGGTSGWSDICTDTTAPYSCAWDTNTVANGPYDLRAVLTDGVGRTTTSNVVAGRQVDNLMLRAFDVQTSNGGTTAGRMESGDLVTLTYNTQVNLATVTPGWAGEQLAVTLRVRDGSLLGLGAKGDTLDVLRQGSSTPTNLGSVALEEDYVSQGRAVTFNATMTASTRSVGGVTATVVDVRLGILASGSGLRTVSLPATMSWQPSTAVLDLQGRVCSGTTAYELGAADREF